MFGVKTAGQLGNTQELEIASELFDKQVIKPYQRVLKQAVESILQAAGTPALVTSRVVETDAEIIEDPDANTQLSEDALNLACDMLLQMGEDESMEGYELIDSRRVDYDTEAQQDAMWSFARVPSGRPQAKSEQDNELVKVRYAYMPKVTGSQGTATYESRDFCKRMVRAGNRVWRKEDIEAASGANPGWGPNGSDNYDLFLYKGGGSCQHFWERRTYLRKNNKKISVTRARTIIREAGLEPMERNSRKVAKRPRDMANRGFIEPQNITTPK
jgi:hypothetical protein